MGSLKAIKDSAREKIKASQEGKEVKGITTENLAESWQQAVEMIASNKLLYKSALMESEVTFSTHDIFIAASTFAVEFLRTERLNLLDFFKRHYQNEEINILFQEKEPSAADTSKHVPSTREVFETMASKNPYLKQLKDGMGFDFEY